MKRNKKPIKKVPKTRKRKQARKSSAENQYKVIVKSRSVMRILVFVISSKKGISISKKSCRRQNLKPGKE